VITACKPTVIENERLLRNLEICCLFVVVWFQQLGVHVWCEFICCYKSQWWFVCFVSSTI